ncbi:MAG: NADP-dependent isocitrate dehydrogenase [Pontibacterium sp.]
MLTTSMPDMVTVSKNPTPPAGDHGEIIMPSQTVICDHYDQHVATCQERWAQALAAQTEDAELATQFAPVAAALTANEDKIVAELAEVQGKAVDLGGYYHAPREKVDAVMCPSTTLNEIVAGV